MAKMTINNLQGFISDYVDNSMQAGEWNPSTNNFVGMLDKIGKQITIDGDFNDPLPELTGDELPLGKTIEEYFIDLTLPTDYDASGANAMAPHMPSVEDCAYSYSLGRKVIATTERFDNIERACNSAEVAGSVTAKIFERLRQSQTLYTYACKKQLLANTIDKALDSDHKDKLITSMALPTDTAKGEAFIKSVKGIVEDAKFANEGNSLGSALIGATPMSSFVLYVKKGIMPSLEVDVEAGAFNGTKVALPCQIKVLDDFGDEDERVYALLVDTRGVKLHKGYEAIRDNVNGEGDFINYFEHSEYTGFISKNTFLHVWTTANDQRF